MVGDRKSEKERGRDGERKEEQQVDFPHSLGTRLWKNRCNSGNLDNVRLVS